MTRVEPAHDYWARILVSLTEPLIADEEVVVGYSRLFGLYATEQNVRVVISTQITDGVVDWSKSEWYRADRATLDETIQQRSVEIAGEGVWYRSGRILFPAGRN